jgi:glutathione S-transferase
MAIVEPTNLEVKMLEGLHLYHGDISNCSMRVRMTLDEKGLDWTSHHIDLKKKENVTEAYFGINPNGLVPALVHNGVVHIESNEIIDYLDRTFPDPPLRQAGSEAEMLEWLRLAASIHVPAIKPYVYATMMQKKVQKTEEEERRYQALQKNEELKEFHSKHAGKSEFRGEDVEAAERRLDEVFNKLNETLTGRPWVMGEKFTLADISWIPIHFVLVGCGYPFDRYPEIVRWAENVNEQKSFKSGVLQWCPDFAKV